MSFTALGLIFSVVLAYFALRKWKVRWLFFLSLVFLIYSLLMIAPLLNYYGFSPYFPNQTKIGLYLFNLREAISSLFYPLGLIGIGLLMGLDFVPLSLFIYFNKKFQQNSEPVASGIPDGQVQSKSTNEQVANTKKTSPAFYIMMPFLIGCGIVVLFLLVFILIYLPCILGTASKGACT